MLSKQKNQEIYLISYKNTKEETKMKFYKGKRRTNNTVQINKVITYGEHEWEILYNNLISEGFFHVGERNKGAIFSINRRRRTFTTMTNDQAKRWRI